MRIEKHIHKLKKHKYKTGATIFFCTLNCNFKIDAALVIGKECLCNICQEPFVLTELSAKLIRPHCSKCGKKAVRDKDGNKRFINKHSKFDNLEANQTVNSDEIFAAKEKLANPINSFVSKVETKTEDSYDTVKDDEL